MKNEVDMAKKKKEEKITEQKEKDEVKESEKASETVTEEPEKDPLQEELEHYKDALLRERADFENYKKRNNTAVSKTRTETICSTVEKFLPVLDNIERALASTEEPSPLKEGIELVEKQMHQILESLGITEIEAEGKPFDPGFHNAVMQVDGEEGDESGTVKQVFQKGYRHGDQVIRHSMVTVVK